MPARAGRDAPTDQVGVDRVRVAVTGAAGPVARLLIDRLTADPSVGEVVAVDATAMSGDLFGDTPHGVRLVSTDSCDPAVATAFGGCDVVVHLDPDPVRQQLPGPRPDELTTDAVTAGGLPPMGRPSGDGAGPTPDPASSGTATGPELELLAPVPAGRAVRAAQTVLTAAAAAGVRTVVLVTSAMVYGAGGDGAVLLGEDESPAADPVSPMLRDMLEIERVAAAAGRTHPGLGVAILRPAALVGPGVDTLVTRHFESPRLLTVRGAAMRWQFCHLDDLVAALQLAATRPLRGALTVASTGWLAQEEVERLSGLSRVELPESLAFGTAERLHRLGLTPAPAGELRFVTRPWVVPSTRLRDAGWRPLWDNADAFSVLLEEARGRVALAGRRIGRRETATLSAAGATVAVLGTAAIVRRARRARRRG